MMRELPTAQQHQDPNPGIILATGGQDNPENPIPAPGPYPWRPTPRQEPACRRYTRSSNGPWCATCGRSPGRHELGAVLATLATIAAAGPLEADEHAGAITAATALWNALHGPAEARERHLQAYREAGRRVTLADFWAVLGQLAEEVGA